MVPLLGLLLIVAGAGGALGQAGKPPEGNGGRSELPRGLWAAELASPGGPLRFGLELSSSEGSPLQAWLVNGSERIAVPHATWAEGQLLLDIDHYDSRVTAELTAASGHLELSGRWEKRTSSEGSASLEFRATPPPITGARATVGTTVHSTAGSTADSASSPAGDAGTSLTGRWRVQFESDAQPAVGLFAAGTGETLTGTFLTTTGDYRYLAGTQQGGQLELACFDGAHAFLFHAELQDDGSLRGDFWSRDVWHETWTAVRDEEARLPDGFALTRWTAAADLSGLSFPDLDGVPRSLDDPAFRGKARILQLFGSWCPNCHDASEYLAGLHERYRARGLSIVGLAFEITGDHARDAGQVRRYAVRHGVRYPLLIAGLADKGKAGEAFPLLDAVRSFPTTVFMHADGRVRAVYQGFSGPATGEAYEQLTAAFEALVEELLAEEH